MIPNENNSKLRRPPTRVIDIIFKKYAENLCTEVADIKEVEKEIEKILIDFSKRTKLKVKALKLEPVENNKFRLIMEVL